MAKYKAEEILPYDKQKEKTEQVRDMFDSIAPAYDFMNRAMTFGIDKWWRNVAVRMLASYSPKRILDVATGTGDLAILLNHKLSPDYILGIDLSEGMLSVARQKVPAQGLNGKIEFEVQDCLDLKLENDSFDAVTVAYGVRNFEHLEQGFSEMHRVLRPGGILSVIELSTPEKTPYKQLYKFYSFTLIPAAGRLISKDKGAYSYLPRSIAAVPQGDAMLKIFRRAGFSRTRCRRLTFGACSIYMGEKE